MQVARAVNCGRTAAQALSRRRNWRSRSLISAHNNSSADQPRAWANAASSNSFPPRRDREIFPPGVFSSSKFTLRAFFTSFSARSRAGRCFGMPSNAECRACLRAVFLGLLDFFPVRPDLVHVFDLGPAENVRMAADQFVHDHAGRPFQNQTRRVRAPAGNGKPPATASRPVPRPSRDRRAPRWRQSIHRLPRWRGGAASGAICSRSHGQPVGERSRAMTLSKSLMAGFFFMLNC